MTPDTTAQIFLSDQPTAHRLLQSHNLSHIVVIFGGKSGYKPDTISLLHELKQHSNQHKSLPRSSTISPQSLLHQLAYVDFGYISTQIDKSQVTGYDVVRKKEIVDRSISQTLAPHLQEVWTSQNWIVRIFRVL